MDGLTDLQSAFTEATDRVHDLSNLEPETIPILCFYVVISSCFLFLFPGVTRSA